ncbi:MAG: hypothetical protein IKA17_01425 [Clostridia bacterium]|nr:hypothetical protein [Clostridia bacterium]
MKKLGSILVTLVFLITLIGAVPSFAAAPTASSFTFTDLESNGTYSSGQAGYNGSSTAIKLAASGANVRATIGTSNFTNYGFTADNSLVMTMRIKFNGAATSDYSLNANMNTSNYGQTWSIKGDGTTGKYNFRDQSGSNIPLNGDKWYNITTHFKGIYAWTYVVDETGVQVGYKYSQTYSSAPTERPLYLWSANTTENGLLIDDLKIYSVNTTDTFSYVAEGSTATNSEIGDDGLITVKFDQPIIPAKSNFSVAGATVESVVAKDFNTAIVKVSGLSAGQTYALDFSAVKSVAGTALTGTTSLSFKTPAAEIEPKVVFTDDFNGTFNTNYFTSSTIFYDGQWKQNYIADANGYNGGTTGLKLTYGASSADNSYNHVKTKTLGELGLSADTTMVFNTRFKLNGTPTSGYSWTINLGSGYVIGTIAGTAEGKYSVTRYGGGDPATLNPDTWYDLIVPLGTTGAAWGYIYDSATGEFIVQTQGTGVTANMPASRLFIQTSTLTENLSMTLDDAKLYCIAKTATFSKIAGGTEENAVIGEDGLLTVKFDQPIIPAKSNFTVAGGTVESVKVKNFDTAIVKVSGITAGQSYTLNFSAIKSAAGSSLAGTSTLAFNTPAKTHFTQGYVFGTDFNNDVFKDSSEIFFEGKWSDNTYSQADGYPTGEKGIKIENPDDDPVADQLTTKRLSSFGLSRDNVLIFTTRFKFSGESSANTYWNIYPVTSSASLAFIGGGVDGKYYADSEPIEADKWYNISVAIRPDQRSVLMINDSVTGETIIYKSAKTPATSVVDYAYNFLWFQTTNLVKGTSLTLADTDIYIVSKDDTLTVDAAASTAQNATIAPDGTIAVQFDMPVFSNKVVGVEDGVATVSKNNFTVDGADIGKIGVIDFNKVVVGFYNLDAFEDYVLDFADIVYEGGAGLDSSSVSSIAFTVGADINNPITAGKATYANGEINLKLYSETEQSVKLYAAFYNGTKLLGVETATGTATSSKNDATITIDGTYESADSIRIFGWNNNLAPIMAIKNITLATEE